jgi:hypothetical protein
MVFCMTANKNLVFQRFQILLLAGALGLLAACKEKPVEPSANPQPTNNPMESNYAAPTAPQVMPAAASSRPPAHLMKGVQPPPAPLPQ